MPMPCGVGAEANDEAVSAAPVLPAPVPALALLPLLPLVPRWWKRWCDAAAAEASVVMNSSIPTTVTDVGADAEAEAEADADADAEVTAVAEEAEWAVGATVGWRAASMAGYSS